MLKKLLSVAIVLIAIGASGTVAYTAGGDDTTKNPAMNVEVAQQQDLEITSPEDKLATTDNIILLSGKGKEGTNVTIEVYSTVSISKETFTLDNLPEDDEYILLLTESFEIGSIGSFAKEKELKKGLYKIVFSVKKSDKVNVVATRYIYITSKEDVIKSIDNITEKPFIGTISSGK